mmetsp:Transcript_46152/g.122480  ORF Transcript_46152/g.122480 Transcript_46152/m.122480 type:complete len:234 (-) Transcript_46152:257-958(-)
MWSTRRASRHHDEQKHVHERGLSPSVSSGGRTRMTSLSLVSMRSAVGDLAGAPLKDPDLPSAFASRVFNRTLPSPMLRDANMSAEAALSEAWLPQLGTASLAPLARDSHAKAFPRSAVSRNVGVGRHMLHPAPPHAMHSVAAAFCASPSDAWPPGGAAAAPSTERWDFVDFVLLNCRTAAGSTATSVSAATRVISLAMLFQSPGHVKKRPRPWKPQRFSAPSLRNSCTTRSPR